MSSQEPPLKYRFIPVGELADRPIKSCEGDYRQGYAQGYAAAIQDLEELRGKGYGRMREILNILNFHLRRLQWWRYNRKDPAVPFLPPRMPDRPTWPALRAMTLKRDGYRCVWCGSDKDLQADHIKQVQNGGIAAEDNLRTLCRPCNLSRGPDSE